MCLIFIASLHLWLHYRHCVGYVYKLFVFIISPTKRQCLCGYWFQDCGFFWLLLEYNSHNNLSKTINRGVSVHIFGSRCLFNPGVEVGGKNYWSITKLRILYAMDLVMRVRLLVKRCSWDQKFTYLVRDVPLSLINYRYFMTCVDPIGKIFSRSSDPHTFYMF